MRIGRPSDICVEYDRFQVVDASLRQSDIISASGDEDGTNSGPGTTIIDVEFDEGEGSDVTVTVTDPETGLVTFHR